MINDFLSTRCVFSHSAYIDMCTKKHSSVGCINQCSVFCIRVSQYDLFRNSFYCGNMRDFSTGFTFPHWFFIPALFRSVNLSEIFLEMKIIQSSLDLNPKPLVYYETRVRIHQSFNPTSRICRLNVQYNLRMLLK